jgi:predicted translin family RNA/ssDNA-binding protein
LASRTNQEEERKVSASACVAEIRELCVQFQRAIAALAANDIAELETATAAQDSLIDKLKNWFRGQPSDQQPSVKVSPSDFRELANLTQVYSYLLEKALRTSRLRAALCETYKQNFPSESEPAPATGWSCEA